MLDPPSSARPPSLSIPASTSASASASIHEQSHRPSQSPPSPRIPFSRSSNRPKKRQPLRAPVTTSEWDAFLTMYSVGGCWNAKFTPKGDDGVSPDSLTNSPDEVEAETGAGAGAESESPMDLDSETHPRDFAYEQPESEKASSLDQNQAESRRPSSIATERGPVSQPGESQPHRLRSIDDEGDDLSTGADDERDDGQDQAEDSDTRHRDESDSDATNRQGHHQKPQPASGLSNQDPEIPNIPPSELRGAQPNADAEMERRRDKQPAMGGEALTRENMRLLKKGQDDADREKKDEEDEEEKRNPNDPRRDKDGAWNTGTAGEANQSIRVELLRRKGNDEMTDDEEPEPASFSRRQSGEASTVQPNRRGGDEDNGMETRPGLGRKQSRSSTGTGKRKAGSRIAGRRSGSKATDTATHGDDMTAGPRPRRSTTSRGELDESTTGSSLSGNPDTLPIDLLVERERLQKFYAQHGYMPAPVQSAGAVRRRLRTIRRLGLDGFIRPSNRESDAEQSAAVRIEQRETLDRLVRLAKSIFGTSMAFVDIITEDKQVFLSEEGMGVPSTNLDVSFCCHCLLSPVGGGQRCLIVPDADRDWRFARNPLVSSGKIKFYAGAPLLVGSKNGKGTIIGTLSVLDNKPRSFSTQDAKLLQDLAECVVSELELLYSRQETIETAKLHHISVEFLRRSLRHRPHERAGQGSNRQSGTGGTGDTGTSSTGDSGTSGTGKRRSGADANQSEDDVDIYDEACREIRLALDAYAVAVVDLSQYHIFFPTYQSSSIAPSTTRAGSSSLRAGSSMDMRQSNVPSRVSSTSLPLGAGEHGPPSLGSGSGLPGVPSMAGPTPSHLPVPGLGGSPPKPSPLAARLGGAKSASSSSSFRAPHSTASAAKSLQPGATSMADADGTVDSTESAYGKQFNKKRARQTWALTDPTAPGRTPQVLFIPRRTAREAQGGASLLMPGSTAAADADQGQNDLAMLGYSCEREGFAFNFTSTPAARRIISDFIATHVQTRRVWFTRDDSLDVAQSINHLMPPGTEASLAMPVFGFDGQVAFAVVACWTDPLFTYPTGTVQFVETIAGSLLASVMKEKLHQAERAQLHFASAASHELRTPLHQINAAAALLRQTLQPELFSPVPSPKPGEPFAPPPTPYSDYSTPTPGDEVGTTSMFSNSRSEAMAQLEIIESNGAALGNILENIIDTLDIGRSGMRESQKRGEKAEDFAKGKGDTAGPGNIAIERVVLTTALSDPFNGAQPDPERAFNLADTVENLIRESVAAEVKARRVAELPSFNNVEVIVEVLPRTRGGWVTTNEPGPLVRALSKIIHNALKFTDRGYVHVTMQDVSRDVRLPAGYDNPIKLSTVAIDIKDTGRGMTPQFLETEVLRPFSKADPFMPGSGLGLGLAQRMIEILGGKLAIASTIGQGTLVHVEVPMHLLSEDNDSDVEDADEIAVETERSGGSGSRKLGSGSGGRAGGGEGEGGAGTVTGSGSGGSGARERSAWDTMINSRLDVRQDGILLVGFAGAADLGTRRLGKVLTRNLKLQFCRLVTDALFASLIVCPDRVREVELAALVRAARPGAEVIILGSKEVAASLGTSWAGSTVIEGRSKQTSASDPTSTTPSVPTSPTSVSRSGALSGMTPLELNWQRFVSPPLPTDANDIDQAREVLSGVKITVLVRPFGPSMLQRIVEPPEPVQHVQETYVSDVVGGDAARAPVTGAGTGTEAGTAAGARATADPGIDRLRTAVDTAHVGDEEQGKEEKDTGENEDEILPSPQLGPSSLPPMEVDPVSSDEDGGLGQGSDRAPTPNDDEGGGVGTSEQPGPELQDEGEPPLTLSGMGTPEPIKVEGGGGGGDETGSRTPRASVGELPRQRERTVVPTGSQAATVAAAAAAAASAAATTATSTSTAGAAGVPGVAESMGTSTQTSSAGPGSGQGQGPDQAQGTGTAQRTERLKVLVVEDNAVNRRILTTMLRRVACDFAEAIDGEDAVTQFKAFHPDLVLLDINMPKKDGFEAASEMRAVERARARAASGRGSKGSRGGASTAAAASAAQESPSSTASTVASPPVSEGSESTSTGTPTTPTPTTPHANITPTAITNTTTTPVSTNSTSSPSAPKRARIIAVTAMSSEGQQRRGMLECGIDEWRTKPVSLKELRAVVEKMIE